MQHPFQIRFSNNSKRRHAAFSLLEVAIALGIFVFGALAIVRIFPGGLAIIQSSGDQQAALNVSRTTLARLQKEPFRVPEAIYDNNLNGTFTYSPLFDGAVLASSKRGKSLPSGPELITVQDSALGRFKIVRGEGAIVQKDAAGNLFVLTQFPIDRSNTPILFEKVNIEGVQVLSNGNLDFSNANYENGTPFVAPVLNGTYYVTYKFRTSATSPINVITEEPIANPTPLNVSAPTQITGATVVAGIVEVSVRVPITLSTPLTPTDKENSLGVINLGDPTITPPTNPTSIDGSPITAKTQILVDYIADWQRLIQDGVPDAPAESTFAVGQVRQLTTGAPSIARSNEAVYSLVIANPTPAPTPSSNLLISQLGRSAYEPSIPATLVQVGDPQEAKEDFRAGRLNFDVAGREGSFTRVSYQTQDFWTQQFSVAARTYKPQGFGSPEPWREYKFETNRLSFLPMDAGKSILVSFTSASGENRDKMFTISDKADADGRHSFRLQDEAGNFATAIQSVRGANMIVRTAYLSGNRYKQAFVSAMRPQGDTQ